MSDPVFYMQEIGKPTTQSVKNLEADFPGMKYVSCKGLSTKGKPRIYSEVFPESNGSNYYIPDTPTVDATDIEFVFAFIGINRRDTFDNFYNYIFGKKILYWDTIRKRQAEIILSDKVEPSSDYLHGNSPYILATFKFTNINGLTTIKN